MKTARLGVVLVLGGVAFGSLSILRAQQPAVANSDQAVGRYQISNAGTTIWLVDTVTGRTWAHDLSGWSNAGNPTTRPD